MQVTGTTGQTTTAAAATDAAGSQSLDKEAFLKLLVTQLQNQDPLSPMDNTTFLAQLAQFSSLEQMQNLNDNFTAFMGQNQMMNNSAAAGLIGRQVQANDDTVTLGASGTVPLSYSLPSGAATATIEITDASGNLVRTIAGVDASAGAHSVDWDGTDDAGTRQPAAGYTFKVTAAAQDGSAVAASTMVQGLVDGVTYRDGGAYLLVGGQEVPLTDVVEVSADGTGSN